MRGACSMIVASANFGGAVPTLPLRGQVAAHRLKQVELFSRSLYSAGGPLVLALQEMVRLPELVAEDPLERLLATWPTGGTSYFASAASTQRYPIGPKWSERWTRDGPLDIEEGLATLVTPGLVVRAPSTGTLPLNVRGGVIDLPTFAVAADPVDAAADAAWFIGRMPAQEASPVRFKPTYYRGSRDTQPRLATVHLLSAEAAGGGVEMVLLNLHLTTLSAETQAADGASQHPRVRRIPKPEGQFIRFSQLAVVAEFIDFVYAKLRVPVVVVGDFNCCPGDPEMDWFLDSARLQAAFDPRRCHVCGRRLDSVEGSYSTRSASGIPETAPDVEVPSEEEAVTAAACCGEPMFTHREERYLTDNVLITAAVTSEELELGTRLELDFDDDRPSRGIDATVDFSDHFPLWTALSLEPLRRS